MVTFNNFFVCVCWRLYLCVYEIDFLSLFVWLELNVFVFEKKVKLLFLFYNFGFLLSFYCIEKRHKIRTGGLCW